MEGHSARVERGAIEAEVLVCLATRFAWFCVWSADTILLRRYSAGALVLVKSRTRRLQRTIHRVPRYEVPHEKHIPSRLHVSARSRGAGEDKGVRVLWGQLFVRS